jgi:ABC-type uncharacterized transport system permease subunit
MITLLCCKFLIASFNWIDDMSYYYFSWLIFLAVCVGISYTNLAYLAWQHNNRHDTFLKIPRWQDTALIITTLSHTLLLLFTLLQPTGSIAFGYAQGLSLAACVGMYLFIIESRFIAIDSLRPFALSLPALAVILGEYLPATFVLPTSITGVLHVLMGIAAHGVALLAAGHALLLLGLQTVLKQRQAVSANWAKRLTRHCPPLIVLERLLIHQSIWTAGLLLLTIGLGIYNGLLRFEHKTILSIMSLFVWLAVPYGYQKYAWRGLNLCIAVWTATGLLLLSYVGSRFILHAVLGR